MKPIFKNKSINQVTKIIVSFTALITIFITLMLFLNTYNEHLNNLVKIEQNYIKSQKNLIKQETQRVLRYIKYKHQTKQSNITIKQLQDNIVDTIENVRDIRNGSSYIFIYTFKGINIADPILKYNAGKNLINFKDSNDKYVIRELIEISNQKNGGFVKYVWNKPITNILTNKISYAISYKPFKWMIGSGVYLDDIKNVLEQKKEEYKTKMIKYIIQIAVFVLAIFLSSIAISRYFTFLIQKDIDNINGILQNVSISYEKISLEIIIFKEFKQIAFNINFMIDELKELNSSLENKVKDRTLKLKQSEQFAYKLVKDQDKFIKNAIHEINTPLSIIIINIDLFKLKYNNNKYLSKIEAGSKIIHNIYNDLSYLIKKDRIEYPKKHINFSEFLFNRIEFFNEVAQGNHLELNFDIKKNIFIYFSEIQLQRICDNSLSNAIKYSYENKIIGISLNEKKDYIVCSIKNVGDTISNPNRLFTRFYRENDFRGGFGLGLNIIKDICSNNNVKIKVISNNNITYFIYKFKKEK
jgi:signal transduction histidine kinase